MTARVVFSMACRAVTNGRGDVVKPGHGGRYSSAASALCPHCGRPMTITGTFRVVPVPRG